MSPAANHGTRYGGKGVASAKRFCVFCFVKALFVDTKSPSIKSSVSGAALVACNSEIDFTNLRLERRQQIKRSLLNAGSK